MCEAVSGMPVYPVRTIGLMTTSQGIPAQPTPLLHTPGPYLTEAQLAARWQVHPGSLANARGRGRNVVPFVKLLGRVRYPLALVEQYEDDLLSVDLAA